MYNDPVAKLLIFLKFIQRTSNIFTNLFQIGFNSLKKTYFIKQKYDVLLYTCMINIDKFFYHLHKQIQEMTN